MSYHQGSEYSEFFKILITATKAASIEIHKNATIIQGKGNDDYAFKDCSPMLESFTFQSDPALETIQQYAFYNCIKLQQVDLSVCTHLHTIEFSAFSSCISVSKLLLPSSVSVLGPSSFWNTSVVSVFLPPSITLLGLHCFTQCKKLSSLEFGSGIKITHIPRSFVRFSSIKNITIPLSVQTIDEASFEAPNALVNIFVEQGNNNFKSIDGVLFTFNLKKLLFFPSKHSTTYNIPAGVTVLGVTAFSSSIISQVTIPDSCESIEIYCFQFTPISSIIIPDSVTYIGQYVFNGCKQLISIKMPANITQYSAFMFASCAFKSFIIPEGVTTIDNSCFMGCSSLKEVQLPSTISKFGGGVFSGCPKDIDIRFAENSTYMIYNIFIIIDKKMTTVYQYLGSDLNDDVILPGNITNIESRAFQSKSNIRSIIFEGTPHLKSIQGNAFSGCSSLANFVMPLTVSEIKEYAFSGCKSLTSIEFGSSLSKLGINAFASCEQLASVIFPTMNNNLALELGCFKGCTALSTLTLPKSTISFGDEILMNCISLKELIIPNTLNSIGQNAFKGSGLIRIEFEKPNNNINKISPYMFYQSTHLEEIILPDGIRSLEMMSFSNTNITTFTLPIQVHTIEQSCFQDCPRLTSFVIPIGSMLTTIGNKVFSGCSSLKLITSNTEKFVVENAALFKEDRSTLIVFPPAATIKTFCFPPQVRFISSSAFLNCLNLEIIIIPDESVNQIGFGAFEGCKNLHTFNIPKCVTYVDQNAFLGCSHLRCGLSIENRDPQFLSDLVQLSKLPIKCIKQCNANTCKCNCRLYSSFSHAFIFIDVLLFHK